MDGLIIIALVSAFASALTFFSGFGLGTILTPVFAVFFPLETAIALTGVVHLLNNIFKIGMVYRHINLAILFRFGATAIIGAYIGARLMLGISKTSPLLVYQLGDSSFEITPIRLTIALLMIIFALFDIIPALKNISIARKHLVAGGFISGLFGGLSGHQGALRSAFLIRFNLPKEMFIATGIAIACCIDVTRLAIYSSRYSVADIIDNYPLLLAATLAAFAGAWAGNRLLKKVTISFIQVTVAFMLIILALLIGAGII